MEFFGQNTALPVKMSDDPATEPRGCLLNKFLDMRKRSLIRSESQDSGFSLETYEHMVSSFDAESFLEELGFGAANKQLIPARFIPSLIHRVSEMPDETVMKLDSRVWKSIDSFKKNKHTLWYSTYSSVDCDLCMHNLRRSFSLPPQCPQGSCNSLYPERDVHDVTSSSNAALRVQSWLSRFPDNSLSAEGSLDINTEANMSHFPDNSLSVEGSVDISTKANMSHIGNQSSTESGFASILEEDDALPASCNAEGNSFNDFCSIDDSGFLTPERKYSKPTMLEKRLSSGAVEDRTPSAETLAHDAETITTMTFVFPEKTGANDQSGTPPSGSVSLWTSSTHKQSPSSRRRRHGCTSRGTWYNNNGSHEQINSNSITEEDHAVGIYQNSNTVGRNDAEETNPSEAVEKSEGWEVDVVGRMECDLRRQSLKKMPTDGQLFLLLLELESINRDTCFGRKYSDCYCLTNSTGLDNTQNDANSFTLPISLSSNCDTTESDSGFPIPSCKKRHSFDAAFPFTAAERRKRFRQSHAKSHSFLFERLDGSHSGTRVNEMVTDETTPGDSCNLRDFRKESPTRYSAICSELHPGEQSNGLQDISDHTGSNEDKSFVKLLGESTRRCSSSTCNEQHIHEQGTGPHDVPGHTGSNKHKAFGELQKESPRRYSATCSELHEQGSGPRDISGQTESNEDKPFGKLMGEPTRRCSSTCIKQHEQGSGPHDVPGHTGSNVHNSFDDLQVEILQSFEHGNGPRDISSPSGSNEDISFYELQEESPRSSSATCDKLHFHEQDSDISVNCFELAGDSCCVSSLSDSELSGRYFPCDERFSERSESSTEDSSNFCKLDYLELAAPLENFTDFTSRLPGDQRGSTVEIASQSFTNVKRSSENFFGSMHKPNRTFSAVDKENMLNKILKRSLRFSLLGPIPKVSKHFVLKNVPFRNDAESFSQILNSSDFPPLWKSNVLGPNGQSLTDITGTSSYRALPNPGTPTKSVSDRRMSDETEALDNRHSISKPIVDNLSLLPSDMCSQKCEVKLIDYGGLTLFWSARNIAETDGSTYFTSDPTGNGSFTSGIHMAVNTEDEIDGTHNKVYFSEVCLEVNDEEAAARNRDVTRVQKNVYSRKFQPSGDAEMKGQHEILKDTKTAINAESPCGRALRDLEELRIAIQKAKETRISASRELRLLQELLHGDDNEEYEVPSERVTSAAGEPTCSFPDTTEVNENQRSGRTTEALSELQQKATKDTSQNKEFWEEEIRKAKEEISQVCHEKLSIMEEKLRTTEGELSRALDENGRLKDQLELRSEALTVCKCNAEDRNSDFAHMNGGISDDDPKITVVIKPPSIPTKDFWQEWDRLQSDLTKAERKADELNVLLNQKLIELNKMQLTLSKQTKEMIFLEKAYFQLRSHLSRRRHSKVATATPANERTSETSPKTSDPEIPP